MNGDDVVNDADIVGVELEVFGDPDAPVCIDGVCAVPGMTEGEPAPAQAESES